MERGRKIASLLALAASVSLVANPSASSTRMFAPHVFRVLLDGSQEVPPVVTAGTGTVTVTLDDVTGAVNLMGQFSGLTSTATMAHIHGPAPVGMEAGIILGLTETGGTSGTVSGSGVFSSTEIADLLAGLHYVNVHSMNFIGGEIRGQIVDAVPAMSFTWVAGLVAAALLLGAVLLRRRSSPAVASA